MKGNFQTNTQSWELNFSARIAPHVLLPGQDTENPAQCSDPAGCQHLHDTVHSAHGAPSSVLIALFQTLLQLYLPLSDEPSYHYPGLTVSLR